MDVRGKSVYVGLSGGVDSAVSAALLKEAGAKVTGMFIKGWYPPEMPCTWAEDRRDAMRVAAKLHIPFETLDASAEYKKSVIDYLLAEYRAGRTPNPDVMCNREVKFGAFYRYAVARGAEHIATGHYRTGEKDQSYFLWAVPKEILRKTIFPVGSMEKPFVRALAKKFDLLVAEKKDSQGVCFLGSISVEEFLRMEFGEKPGRAVDEDGKEVGTHNGALLHTLGERIALRGAPGAAAWYVLGKDLAKNELIVGKNRFPRAAKDQKVAFTNENWLDTPEAAKSAQYRYRGPHVRGRVEGNNFIPDQPLAEIPAPGQSLVFFKDDELVGGGIIAG